MYLLLDSAYDFHIYMIYIIIIVCIYNNVCHTVCSADTVVCLCNYFGEGYGPV